MKRKLTSELAHGMRERRATLALRHALGRKPTFCTRIPWHRTMFGCLPGSCEAAATQDLDSGRPSQCPARSESSASRCTDSKACKLQLPRGRDLRPSPLTVASRETWPETAAGRATSRRRSYSEPRPEAVAQRSDPTKEALEAVLPETLQRARPRGPRDSFLLGLPSATTVSRPDPGLVRSGPPGPELILQRCQSAARCQTRT